MSGNALVIGGTGFLGTAIVRELHAAGWQATCLGRGRQANSFDDVPLLIADRSQPGELARVTRDYNFDLVVDCAAFKETDAIYAIDAFHGRTGLYVFISTDFVYAPAPDALYPLRENAAVQHELPYATGKLACEAALRRAWEERQFPFVVLRPPHILGAGRALGCDPLVMREMQLLNDMRAGRELPLLAEGQLLIQPVWNREIGRCIAHLAAMDDGKQGRGRIFNCAGPDCITTRCYYEIIADYLGVPLRYRSVSIAEFVSRHPEKAHMARHRIYNHNLLREMTGYEPSLRVEDAIQETARWMDAQVAHS